MAASINLSNNPNNTFSPLADYFFIAGIESSQILEERPKSTLLSGETIEEHSVLETESTPRPRTPDGTDLAGSPRPKSRFSYDARKSFTSLLSQESKVASNRSSATIRQVHSTGGLSDEDFDAALKKFANERDSFLEEMHVNGGSAPAIAKLRARPKTQRIISDDAANSMRSGVGSLRRRLSTMNNSLKRSPSVMRPAPSVRTSKRLSGYNSVIPTPQPFHLDANTHPLKRHYEPVLLDRYPPKASAEEAARSSPFPDYVPMFAFPNDINVVSADERPKPIWHGFAMTIGDGSKIYGICLTVWLPLNSKAAEGLERLCEKWRQSNMSPEERELAGSLGERLALERAKLSRLLAELPTILQGSTEREELEEQISAVEEKIGLMADLLRPVRHGAASKIDGLTDGETGLWIPRAYGVMGKDVTLTSFWKEWLRAVAVPMSNNTILGIPPSSPKVGMWQPLERYVINLCAEAPCPISSLTQVEINVRELRLFARKEAVNEIPGSRNIDIFALFRALSTPNIIILLEFILAESRIILLSSHASMLHLASNAIVSLLYPLKWQGVFIPVLPARLIQAIEAPCPYIVGIERRYENVQYPDDDFVLVDLDQNVLESTGLPAPLPRQIRRKLHSLLQIAAPHHLRYGVSTGPPQYAKEAYPENAYSSEHPSLYMSRAPNSTLATLVSFNSTQFDALCNPAMQRAPVFNAFLQSRVTNSRGSEARPETSSTSSKSRSNTGPPSPRLSPVSGQFPSPPTPVSRNDSAHAVHHTLREKRSHIFEHTRRGSSVSLKQSFTMHLSSSNNEATPRGFSRHLGRRPSQNFLGHMPTRSSSTLGSEFRVGSSYAPSVYAPSTMAASTIMPHILTQPVRNTDTTQWVEGHCLQWHNSSSLRHNPTISDTCSLCDERSDGDGFYACAGCNTSCHPRCLSSITLVCPTAFRPEQVRAAFVRCFASLFYTYRRFMVPASYEQKKNGMRYRFQSEAFLKSLPNDLSEYLTLLQDTQSFNEFIHERETSAPDAPTIHLFDQIITSKRNRGKTSWLTKSSTSFLDDTSTHLWRTAVATPPSARFPGDYRTIVSRVPAKLDGTLMKEPRALQGVAKVIKGGKVRRKGVPSISGSVFLNGVEVGEEVGMSMGMESSVGVDATVATTAL